MGILTAATVAIIVTQCFNAYYPAPPFPADDQAGNPALYWSAIQASCPRQADFIWRVVLGFGAFPAACTLYLRATMPETPCYTLHVLRDKAKLAADMASVTRSEVDSTHTVASTKADMGFRSFLRKHGKELLGCAMCWFLLDVAFYSQNLFQKDVFLQIGWLPPAESVNAMTETFRVARAQALIALGSTIPGRVRLHGVLVCCATFALTLPAQLLLYGVHCRQDGSPSHPIPRIYLHDGVYGCHRGRLQPPADSQH